MNEKLTVEEIIDALEKEFENRTYEDAWMRISPRETRTLLDGIREMQEEIKQDKKAMREAIRTIAKGRAKPELFGLAIGSAAAQVILERHLAKDQPKDNGAGDADQESSAVSG